MSDLISRSALLEVLRKSHAAHAETGRDFSLLCRDIRLVKEQPAVDAVPVVRCKDCKHSAEDDWDGSLWCCRDKEREVVEEHFCSYGERKSHV